jgi:hypothetical protein
MTEYLDLISELDELFRYRSGRHDALQVAHANGRDDQREDDQRDHIATVAALQARISALEAGREEALPEWILDEDQPESMEQQIDDAWERAADAYEKAAGCLRGHLEWRDRVRAAIRALIAPAPTKGE